LLTAQNLGIVLTLKIHGKPRWIGRMTPTPEDPLLASTVLTTGENSFDIKLSKALAGALRSLVGMNVLGKNYET